MPSATQSAPTVINSDMVIPLEFFSEQKVHSWSVEMAQRELEHLRAMQEPWVQPQSPRGTQNTTGQGSKPQIKKREP